MESILVADDDVVSGYVFLSTGELCHVVMVRSAAKKIRRKSQREALRLQEQADALLAMEEDEEVLFKRPATSTDTPPGSRADSPGSGRGGRAAGEGLYDSPGNGEGRQGPTDGAGP